MTPWTKTNNMLTERLTPYTHKVTFRLDKQHRRSFFLLSDLHWDNPHCDRELLKKHLDAAVKRDAGVFIFGDLFCAMQGKYDPRGNKEGIRPEHNVANYLDAIIDDCASFFQPYRKHLLMVTPGNHETSILKRAETDLIGRFASAVGCQAGAYAGWVILRSERNTKKYLNTLLSYHHGYGGGGPVTKDVIQASRKAVYLPDADIVVSGHTHDRNIFPIQRTHLNQNNGKQTLREQLHIKLGTYKDEYTAGSGWAIERGMPPKSLGGVAITIHRAKGDTFERNDVYAELL